MLGKIKGWNFLRAYAADGSSRGTMETLTAEKKRLEARLLEIPRIIPQLEDALKRAKGDIAWLKALKWPKKGRWEKEKGKTVEQAIYDYEKGIVRNTARIASLKAEQKQIPSQIKAIQAQLDTLVKGESVGLEKGIDKETAKELGEIELQKEKERLEYERAIREAELAAERERIQLQAEKERREAEAKQAGGNRTKLFIGIGVVLLVLVGGFILYKRRMAKATGS